MTRSTANGKTIRAMALVVALTAVPGGAVGASAQARRQAPPAPADGAGVSPAELQRLFDAYVLMQAQDTLRLTDAQYPRFLSRLKALQDVRRRGQVERARIVQELRRLVQRADGESGAADAINDRLKALRESEARSVSEVLQAVESLDEVLEPAQRARLRIFEEQMERRKLELLMRARQGARGRALR